MSSSFATSLPLEWASLTYGETLHFIKDLLLSIQLDSHSPCFHSLIYHSFFQQLAMTENWEYWRMQSSSLQHHSSPCCLQCEDLLYGYTLSIPSSFLLTAALSSLSQSTPFFSNCFQFTSYSSFHSLLPQQNCFCYST
jgi:hypothetical protein